MTTSDYSDYRSIDEVFQSDSLVVDPTTGEILQERRENGFLTGGDEDKKPVGLSTAHICTYVGGGLVKVQATITDNSQVGGGKRGKVSGFTRASRRRLMQRIAMTKKVMMPVFVTLTYPGAWSEDPKVWKRDLRVFWMRVKRAYPSASAIWKLEFQKRGAPHFHLLVWGVKYAYLVLSVSKLWYEVVGSGDERHLRAGTRVENVRDWRGVMAYASKYLGKVEDGKKEVGRFWGVMSAECIPWAELVTCSLTDRDAYQFIRMLRRFMKIKSRAYKSLTAFADGEFWFDRIDRLRESWA